MSLATIGLVTSAVITVGMAATVFSLVVRSDVLSATALRALGCVAFGSLLRLVLPSCTGLPTSSSLSTCAQRRRDERHCLPTAHLDVPCPLQGRAPASLCSCVIALPPYFRKSRFSHVVKPSAPPLPFSLSTPDGDKWRQIISGRWSSVRVVN